MKNKINSAASLASTVVIALSSCESHVPRQRRLAKKPGTTYCINGICHRVKTVDEVKAEVGLEVTQGASFYDDCKIDQEIRARRSHLARNFTLTGRTTPPALSIRMELCWPW